MASPETGSATREISPRFVKLLKGIVDDLGPEELTHAVSSIKKNFEGKFATKGEQDLYSCLYIFANQGLVSEDNLTLLERFVVTPETSKKKGIEAKIHNFKAIRSRDLKATSVTRRELTGRHIDLQNVMSKLTSGGSSVLNLYGSSGVGKTTLAIEALSKWDGTKVKVDLREINEMKDVHFHVLQALSIGSEQTKVSFESNPVIAKIQELRQQSQGNLLLLLDNVDRLSGGNAEAATLLNDYFVSFLGRLIGPKTDQEKTKFKILLTSRSAFRHGVENYEVKALEKASSGELLQSQGIPSIPGNHRVKLVEMCRGKPLLLNGIAAILRQEIADAEKLLGTIEQELEVEPTQDIGEPVKGQDTQKNETFDIKEEGIDKEQLSCLRKMFFFLPSHTLKESAVAVSLFCRPFSLETAAKILDVDVSEAAIRMEGMRNSKVVSVDPEAEELLYDVHPLMRTFLRIMGNSKTFANAYHEARDNFCMHFVSKMTAISALLDKEYIKAFNSFVFDRPNFELALDILLTTDHLPIPMEHHRSIMICYLFEVTLDQKHRRKIFNHWAEVVEEDGKEGSLFRAEMRCREALQILNLEGWRKAEEVLREADESLSVVQKTSRKTDYFKLTRSSYLFVKGEILYRAGKWPKALRILNRSLEAIEGLLKSHTSTCRCLNAIGNCYSKLGKPEEAIKFYTRAYEMRQELSGSNEHFDLPLFRSQIGTAYETMGIQQFMKGQRTTEAKKNFLQAIKYYQEALALSKKLKLTGILTTALYNRNIANAYSWMMEFEEAKVFAYNAYEIRKDMLGVHPLTARSAFQVAEICRGLENFVKAEEYYEEAWEIEKSLGQGNHSEVRDRIITSYEGILRGERKNAFQKEVLAFYQRCWDEERSSEEFEFSTANRMIIDSIEERLGKVGDASTRRKYQSEALWFYEGTWNSPDTKKLSYVHRENILQTLLRLCKVLHKEELFMKYQNDSFRFYEKMWKKNSSELEPQDRIDVLSTLVNLATSLEYVEGAKKYGELLKNFRVMKPSFWQSLFPGVSAEQIPDDDDDEEIDDDDDDDDDDTDDSDGDDDDGGENDNEDDNRIPSEIKARGPKAKLAFKNALKTGNVKVFRTRIMLIGQDRAGKTSLKKSFIGLPFDPKEQSTDGIDVDPSKFEFEVDQVKNWQRTDEKLDASQFFDDLARKLAGELEEEEKTMDRQVELPQDQPKETSAKENERNMRKVEARSDPELSENIQNEPKDIESGNNQATGRENKNEKAQEARVSHHMVDHSESTYRKPAIPELKIEPALPPEEFIHLLVQYLEGLNLQNDTTAEKHHMTLDLWDFAGQQMYYASYPAFLSSRAVYMLVYNLSKGLENTAEPCVRQGSVDTSLKNINCETNLENLLSWLVSVSTMCSSKPEIDENQTTKKDLEYLRPPIFIVGTHADKPYQDIKDIESKVQRELSGKDFNGHVIRPLFSVDNTQGSSGEGVAALKKRMIEVLEQEPYMGEEVPVRWFNFEKVIPALVAKKTYYMNIKDLQAIIQKVCFIESKNEAATMLEFYHDIGMIVKHRNTVVLRAQWLIDIFKQLITVRSFSDMEPRHSKMWKEMETSGFLSMELVDHAFSKFCQQGVIKEDILNMMEQFGLIAKFAASPTNVKYFVPSQLKTPPGQLCKMEPSPSDPCPLYLHFLGGFVPHGLFTQLVSRCTRWCSMSGFKQQPTLFDGATRFFIQKELLYQLFLICKKRFIKIVLKQPQPVQGASPAEINEVASLVLEFLKQTIQNLMHELPWLTNLTYDWCVPCPCCPGAEDTCSNHGQVSCTHEDCLCLLTLLEEGKLSHCENSFCAETPTVTGLAKWLSIEAVRPGRHPGTDDVYKMTALPRGITLIINNYLFADHPKYGKQPPRLGSDKDVRQVEELFTALGFQVRTKENLTRKEFLDELDSLACSDHNAYDCFVLWLMSHGKSGEVFCSDGVSLPIQTAQDMFSKCDTLRGKPKLFFIQACRGGEEDEGVAVTADISSPMQPTSIHVDSPTDAVHPPVSKVPTLADFLYSFSTVDEHVSYRHEVLGSHYVRALVEAFRERAVYDHLLDILTIVNQKVSNMEANLSSMKNKTDIKIFKQMPEVKHTLRKKVRF